jgi:2-oxoglutarate dehydrogenase E2 component (dihydrolipoamide succinyltransferase)
MSRLRKTVAKRLKESQNTYAQVCTFQEVDMSNIMTMRKELGENFQKTHGIKLGFMSFFIRACTIALQERPIVNSVIDPEGENVISRNYVDISVAVSGPNGLVVPVLRDCDQKGFADLEKGLNELASKAKDGSLALEDMSGGNFTISNGGVFGSMLSMPIINPPQSAILGMHNIVSRPVVRDGEIVARPIMYVSMSYDHRLLDGREGAGFLKRVADLLEDPRKMVLGI